MRFNDAFDRWRKLYEVIDRTEREAFEAERKRGVSPKEREDAERRLEQGEA